jgi:hypothetical protein
VQAPAAPVSELRLSSLLFLDTRIIDCSITCLFLATGIIDISITSDGGCSLRRSGDWNNSRGEERSVELEALALDSILDFRKLINLRFGKDNGRIGELYDIDERSLTLSQYTKEGKRSQKEKTY